VIRASECRLQQPGGEYAQLTEPFQERPDLGPAAGRFLLYTAEELAEKLLEHLLTAPGVEKVTPAGSLRRGRETVGDLDILVTGEGCIEAEPRQKIIEHLLRFPGLMDVIAQGENKVSFRHRNGMQVDVRLLPPESFGAAMQYFTGSKAHNVALRQRALKMGFTLNEYSLANVEDNKPVARKTEEEIYAKLGLDFIPPELRENLGEIEAAAALAAVLFSTGREQPERPADQSNASHWLHSGRMEQLR